MKDIRQQQLIRNTYGDEEIDVIYSPGTPGVTMEQMKEMAARGQQAHVFNFCPELKPETYEAAPGIICERDVAVKMRDGITIYTDIFRPSDTTEKVPVIISWSPFGKRQSEGRGEWQLMGVPPKTVSNMAKFESADPAYWCYKGYAVANVDPRGVGNSEGNTANFDSQEGRDGYDFIEWIAVQDWCNGKTALYGNSGVAMSNWRIAGEQPPHLACIAPWEATGDMYRESLAPGGIPCPSFNKAIIKGIACSNYVDDAPANLEKYPTWNGYWQDKVPKWDKIKVPAYVAAGWCHFHLRGSLEGFKKIRSRKKWLRIHREYEWPDAYNPYNLAELKEFFDRYLKDIHNGWELMPKVRMDVMDAFDYDFRSKREEREWPLARTEYKKLYLDAATHKADYEPYPAIEEVSYNPKTDMTVFDHKFTEETEISGHMKLKLWVECRGHDNMDLFIWIKKLGQRGEFIPIHAIREPYRGAWGYMRVSHRELDEKLSSHFQPVQSHRIEEKLKTGDIVPVEIEIWPHSRMWHKGETLRIEIEGRYIKTEWFEDRKMTFTEDNGDGIHVIHTGGRYDSYLQIPVIPPKYKSGDYEVR